MPQFLEGYFEFNNYDFDIFSVGHVDYRYMYLHDSIICPIYFHMFKVAAIATCSIHFLIQKIDTTVVKQS